MIEGETYKYIGFLQLRSIRHTAIKKELQDKFLHRVNGVPRSFLSVGNKVKAINTFAVPLLIYSVGVVKWTKTDLEVLELAVRVAFIKNCKRHLNLSIERVTLACAIQDLLIATKNYRRYILHKDCTGITRSLRTSSFVPTLWFTTIGLNRVTLIDIAVPLDYNVQPTFSGKITKDHDLPEELNRYERPEGRPYKSGYPLGNWSCP